MPRYIDADKLQPDTSVFLSVYSEQPVKVYSQERIDNAPTEDVAPVKHGHWIKTANTWTHDYNERSKPIYYCSLCGRYEKIKEPYCNCGAKMDGGSRNE